MSSLRVHPDKNPSPDARAAFDALNVAQRHLLDPAKQARRGALCSRGGVGACMHGGVCA
jgi:DnaJ-class molecular chaperone